MVTMRVLVTQNCTWVRAWIKQSYGSQQRPAYVKFNKSGVAVGGICSCTVGRSGLCSHVICILYQLIHVAQTGHLKLEIQCTSQPLQWHRRGKKSNHKQYVPVHKIQIKSAKTSIKKDGMKKRKKEALKRDIYKKVEDIAEKLDTFEVERHFLLTLSANKSFREKGGLYPLLADRYITQAALQDHDYCKPSPTLADESNNKRNVDLTTPSVIYMPVQQTQILYYNVEQRSVEWHYLRANRITASVVGDLLGISGNDKFDESWAVVRGVKTERKKNFVNFQRGIEYEDTARKKFIEESG